MILTPRSFAMRLLPTHLLLNTITWTYYYLVAEANKCTMFPQDIGGAWVQVFILWTSTGISSPACQE